LSFDAITRYPENTDYESKPKLSLDQLRDKAIEDSSYIVTPKIRSNMVRDRSNAIKNYVLTRANVKCEGCNQKAPFETPDGRAYLEPHHIRRLSDGGPDHPGWVSALCPNCHARAHHAKDKQEFNTHLREIIVTIEGNK
jgi:5-methylcytosine-specific restriction protein A